MLDELLKRHLAIAVSVGRHELRSVKALALVLPKERLNLTLRQLPVAVDVDQAEEDLEARRLRRGVDPLDSLEELPKLSRVDLAVPVPVDRVEDEPEEALALDLLLGRDERLDLVEGEGAVLVGVELREDCVCHGLRLRCALKSGRHVAVCFDALLGVLWIRDADVWCTSRRSHPSIPSIPQSPLCLCFVPSSVPLFTFFMIFRFFQLLF